MALTFSSKRLSLSTSISISISDRSLSLSLCSLSLSPLSQVSPTSPHFHSFPSKPSHSCSSILHRSASRRCSTTSSPRLQGWKRRNDSMLQRRPPRPDMCVCRERERRVGNKQGTYMDDSITERRDARKRICILDQAQQSNSRSAATVTGAAAWPRVVALGASGH
jgi:hypothetical protein